MSEENKVQLGYRVESIKTIQFSFEDISEKELEDLMSDTNGLGININARVNIKMETSSFVLDISSELFNSKTKTPLVKHVGRTSYFLQGISSVVNNDGKSVDLPSDMLVQLYGIAYTHSRALLSVELSPTVYRNKYILPVIDPNVLLPKKEVEKS